MDYAWLLFSFKGRINRARYWLALLIILCSMVFALLSLAIISAFFGIATGPLAIDIVMIALSLWGFVEMLCLRGTRGPNRFGPDPLPQARSIAARVQPRIGSS